MDNTLEGLGLTPGKDYALRSSNANRSERIDTSTESREPRLLVIDHTTSKRGKLVDDRHMVQASTTLLDTEEQQHKCVVTLTITSTQGSLIDRAKVSADLATVISLLLDIGPWDAATTFSGSETLGAILRGER